MDIQSLLRPKKCSCGMTHTCQIKDVIIGAGAIDALGDLLAGHRHILLVADTNTYAVCGDAVAKQIGDKAENVQIFECEGFLIPNEAAIEALERKITPKTDLIVGVGSGVIQDLCKYVSFRADLPYFIVATAPSMDGYASGGAAMIVGNMKVTYPARVPRAIIADTKILKDAPMEMIRSGYGDILGKFSCLCDWKLSHVVNGEPLCQFVYDLTYEMLCKTKDLGARLLARDEAAIGTLTEALVGVGVAMAYVGNSRPASGSEHHLSHFFEVTGLLDHAPYFMHGTDVAYSACVTQSLREELLATAPPFDKKPFDRTAWEERMRRVFTAAADGVIALQTKLGWIEEDRTARCAENREAIRGVLSEAPSRAQMLSYLQSVGLDEGEFTKLYGKEKIETAIRNAMYLKDRYTVLWLYNDLK